MVPMCTIFSGLPLGIKMPNPKLLSKTNIITSTYGIGITYTLKLELKGLMRWLCKNSANVAFLFPLLPLLSCQE